MVAKEREAVTNLEEQPAALFQLLSSAGLFLLCLSSLSLSRSRSRCLSLTLFPSYVRAYAMPLTCLEALPFPFFLPSVVRPVAYQKQKRRHRTLSSEPSAKRRQQERGGKGGKISMSD